ncbi:MAG: hypothetical protein M0Z55_04530 [Peptococcaceae bacterium]|nr:hypothetical protein [Peptococcaceae bacterium]
MAGKLSLLQEFYSGLPKNQAKIETDRYGFAYLTKLLAGGASLEYGELTASGVLHKYKIIAIPPYRMDELLAAHIAQECNVCLYFDTYANNLFCFNLDNNYKTDNTVVIPEMSFAVRAIRQQLSELGCEPLIVASGRGYHVWCRLSSSVNNNRLYQFMLRIAAQTMLTLSESGYDYHKIKFNLYPDTRSYKIVSLRLFGSQHSKNKTFSSILTPDGLLDEAASWEYFATYLRHKTIAEAKFSEAYAKVTASFSV